MVILNIAKIESMQTKTMINLYYHIIGDVNGDNRADVFCKDNDGSVMVSKSKNVYNFYEPTNNWMDDRFGLCPAEKWVCKI